jgi:hypothetical protein
MNYKESGRLESTLLSPSFHSQSALRPSPNQMPWWEVLGKRIYILKEKKIS